MVRLFQFLVSLTVLLQSHIKALTPDGFQPISATRSNANAVADYAFKFTVNNSVAMQGNLLVIFPTQFIATNLGIDACRGSYSTGVVVIPVPCTVMNNGVNLSLGPVIAGTMVIVIYDVRNPEALGGTDQFGVKLLKSGYTIEQELLFGTVGITPAASLMTAATLAPPGTIVNSSPPDTPILNIVQTYYIGLTPSVSLESGTWFLVTIAKGFDLSGAIGCSVGGTGVTCTLQRDNTVMTSGSGAALPAGVQFTLSITGVKNPPITGPTGFFKVESFIPKTFTVSNVSPLMLGPVIQPNTITPVTLIGSTFIQDTNAWYTFQFKTINTVPVGGFIVVTMPPEFLEVNGCIISSGLTAVSTPMVCDLNKFVNSVMVSGFQSFTAATVQLRIRAKNPKTTNSSQSVVKTLLPNGNLIDVNMAAGTVGPFTPAPQSAAFVDLFGVKTDLKVGQTGPLELFLECQSVDVLRSTPQYSSVTNGNDVYGEIVVTLPDYIEVSSASTPANVLPNAQFNLAKLSCLFGATQQRAMKCDWDHAKKQITIRTPRDMTGLDQCPIYLYIGIIGDTAATAFGFRFPFSHPGQQVIRLQTYVKTAAGGSITNQEDAFIYFMVPPKLFTDPATGYTAGSATASSMVNYVNTEDMLRLIIVPTGPLAIGYTIEVEFTPANFAGGYATNLGYGGTVGQVVAFPCFASGNIQFTSCEMLVGDNGSSPKKSTFVRFRNAIAALAAGASTTLYIAGITNGPTPGSTRTFTVRSKMDNINETYEYADITLSNLIAIPTISSMTVVISTAALAVQVATPSLGLTFTFGGAFVLQAGGVIVLKFPPMPWTDTSAVSVAPSTAVTVSVGSGSATFAKLVSATKRYIIITATSILNASTQFTFELERSSFYATSSSLEVLTFNPDLSQLSANTLSLITVANTITAATLTEVLEEPTVHLTGQLSLFKLTFTTQGLVKSTGAVLLLFENAKFDLDSCFSLSADFTQGSVCTKEAGTVSYTSTYQRLVIRGWTDNLAAGAKTVYLYAKSLVTPGNVRVVTNYEVQTDLSTNLQLVDESVVLAYSESLTTTLAPTTATVGAFAAPMIEARAGATTYAVLTFDLTIATAITSSAGTGAGQYGYVQVTIPLKGLKYDLSATETSNTFTEAGTGGYYECYFTKVSAGVSTKTLASRCFSPSTRVYRAYSPATTSYLAAGQTVSLSINIRDTGTAFEGFKTPTDPGYYEFLVESYNGSPDTLLQRAQPVVYVGPATSFYGISVTNYNKYVNQMSGLKFAFTTKTAIPFSAGNPGFIAIDFPVGASGWLADLGTGLGPNAPIDCPTTPGLTFTCNLVRINGETTQLRLKFTAVVNAATAVDFILVGITNPTTVKLDLQLKIASYNWVTAASPYYTPLDLSYYSYIDTLLTAVAPSAVADAAATISASTYATSTLTVTLKVNPGTALLAGDLILVKCPADYPVATTPTPTCTYPGSTGVTCFTLPLTGYVLITLGTGTPTAGDQAMTIAQVTSPSYYSTSIAYTSYLFTSRKLTSVIAHTLATPMAKPAITENEITFSPIASPKVTGNLSEYCLKFTVVTAVPQAGQVRILFPSAFATKLKADSAYFGPESSFDLAGKINAKFVIDSTTTNLLIISEFPVAIAAAKTLQVCGQATLPVVATYTGWVYDTYALAADTNRPIDTKIGTASVIVTAASADPVTTLVAGFPYQNPIRLILKDDITPLVITLRLPNDLTKNVGYVNLNIAPVVVFANTAPENLRCIWKDQNGEELISDRCVAAPETVQTLPTTQIKVTAPRDVDILASLTYLLTITTINAGSNGIVWADTAYTVDVQGTIADGSSLSCQGRLYIDVQNPNLAVASVTYDHNNTGQRNRFNISFKTVTAIPAWVAGGRIAIEFPGTLFDSKLGYSRNHAPVSCSVTGLVDVQAANTPAASGLPVVSCYVQEGVTRIAKNPTVIVTGFKAVTASTDVTISLQNILNPSTPGDFQIVWVGIKTLNVQTAGWPGTVLDQQRVNYVFAVGTGSASPYSVPALTSSSSVIASDVTYTFTVQPPSGNTALGDYIYLTLDTRMVIKAATTPTITFSSGTNTYYSLTRTLVLTVNSAGLASVTLTMATFTHPKYIPSPGFSITGTYIRANSVIGYFTSTATDSTFVTIKTTGSPSLSRVDGLVAFYKQDIVDWSFKITPTVDIPAGGGLVITLTSSTFRETTCFNNVDAASALVGSYRCAVSGNVATVTFNSDQTAAAGSSLIFIANVINGVSDDSVTIYTIYNTGTPGSYMEKPAAVNVPMNNAFALSDHQIPLQLKFHDYVRAGGTGSLTFSVVLSDQMTAGAGGLLLVWPTVQGLAPGGTLQCIWKDVSGTTYLASACTVSALNAVSNAITTPFTFTIKAPSSVTLPAGATTVVLTTINAENPVGQGLIYPAASETSSLSVYECLATFTGCTAGGGSSRSATESFLVLPATRFKTFSITYGHRHRNTKNYFRFNFEPNTPLVATNTLEIWFPTHDGTNNLFLPDLGFGQADASVIPCYSAATVACTLKLGMEHVDRPAKIVVTIGAGGYTSGIISIPNILNPTLGGDSMHVHITAVTYLGVVLKDAQTYYDVFNVLNTAPPAQIAGPGLIAPAYAGTAFLTTATLTINFVTTTFDATSIILITLPFSVVTGNTYPITGGTTAEPYPSAASAQQLVSIGIVAQMVITFGTTGLSYAPTGAVISYQHMKNGLIVEDYTFPGIIGGTAITSTNHVALFVMYSDVDGTLFTKLYPTYYQELTITFKPKQVLTKDGCVKFTVDTGTPAIDTSYCRPSYYGSVKQLGTKCALTSTTMEITGFSLDLMANTEVIRYITRAKISTDIKIKAATFASNDCLSKPVEIEDAAALVALTVGLTTPPANTYARLPSVVRKVGVKSDQVDLEFKLKLITLLNADSTTYLKLAPSTTTATAFDTQLTAASTTLSLSCTITGTSGFVPAPCSWNSASKFISVYPSANLSPESAVYTLKVTKKHK